MYNEAIWFSDFIDSEEQDEYGDHKQIEVRSELIFAKVKSISQTEFYQAHTAGMKPEKKFVIPDYFDYKDEKYLIHEGIRYKILKTYQNEEEHELEITCYGGVRDVGAAVSDQDQ